MREELSKIIASHNLINKKPKKSEMTQEELEQTNKNGGKAQSVNILKQNGPINPCLGQGLIERTGKPVTECIFFNFEDFNKLVVFKRGEVSNFVEDLLQYLTIGLVSARSIEQQLSHLREKPDSFNFEDYAEVPTLQEYLIKKKMEQIKKPWAMKEPEISTDVVTKSILKNPEFDFKKQIHIISQPYQIKENIGEGLVPGRVFSRI